MEVFAMISVKQKFALTPISSAVRADLSHQKPMGSFSESPDFEEESLESSLHHRAEGYKEISHFHRNWNGNDQPEKGDKEKVDIQIQMEQSIANRQLLMNKILKLNRSIKGQEIERRNKISRIQHQLGLVAGIGVAAVIIGFGLSALPFAILGAGAGFLIARVFIGKICGYLYDRVSQKSFVAQITEKQKNLALLKKELLEIHQKMASHPSQSSVFSDCLESEGEELSCPPVIDQILKPFVPFEPLKKNAFREAR